MVKTVQPNPCPGCGVTQFGNGIKSYLKRPGANTTIFICKACGQYEDVIFIHTKQQLRGVGKNEVDPSKC